MEAYLPAPKKAQRFLGIAAALTHNLLAIHLPHHFTTASMKFMLPTALTYHQFDMILPLHQSHRLLRGLSHWVDQEQPDYHHRIHSAHKFQSTQNFISDLRLLEPQRAPLTLHRGKQMTGIDHRNPLQHRWPSR